MGSDLSLRYVLHVMRRDVCPQPIIVGDLREKLEIKRRGDETRNNGFDIRSRPFSSF